MVLTALRGMVATTRLLYKNPQIETHNTTMLSDVLYVCETWSLTLREEQRLRVFVDIVLSRTTGPERENGECCTNRSVIICTLHENYCGKQCKKVDMKGVCRRGETTLKM